MPAARTAISGVSSKLEVSFKHPGIALVASDAMFMTPGNTGVVSMTAEDSSVVSMMFWRLW